MLLNGITWLVIFQILGSGLSAMFLPFVPGPIIGLVLLLAYFQWSGGIEESLETASSSLLKYMPLLLVPAATGVMAYFQIIEKQLWPIVGTLVLSLLPSMYFAGWLMQRLIKRQQPGEEERNER